MRANTMDYVVLIVETATGEVENAVQVKGLRRAEKVERGANINLNHSRYHTELLPASELPRWVTAYKSKLDYQS